MHHVRTKFLQILLEFKIKMFPKCLICQGTLQCLQDNALQPRSIILIIFYHAKLDSFQNSTFHFLSKYAHYPFICTFSYKNGRITVNLIEQQTSTFVSIICLSFSLIPRKSSQTCLSIFIPKYRFFSWVR